MPSETFLRLNNKKKENILRAASEVFLEKNFNNAKITDICRKADIPRVTFYSYFESLEDIYLYTYQSFLGEYFNLEKIKSLNENYSFYDSLIDYFVTIVDSKFGLEKIYEEAKKSRFEDRLMINYMISLAIQYKEKIIDKEEFMNSAYEILKSIQK